MEFAKMKWITGGGGASEFIKLTNFFKIPGFLLVSVVFFYLFKHFADVSSQQLMFFNNEENREPQKAPEFTTAAFTPNPIITFNISSLVNDTVTSPPRQQNYEAEPKKVPVSPPPQYLEAFQRIGVVDENGRLSVDFDVGDYEYDSELLEIWAKTNESEVLKTDGEGDRVRVAKFPMCPDWMREYIPCMDNENAIKMLSSTEKGQNYERHCPEEGGELNCLIPAPKGYKNPIPWPRSRDEVWFSNVRLAKDKGGQNWITIKKEKVKFTGGGTPVIRGEDEYLNQIEKIAPEIAFGRHTRVALDVGCGVANFGAYLMSRNVITLSVAPKNVHENQIQFALERGVPAMVAAFATRRLLYPSQAFDLIHCSMCRVDWTRDDGILLLEVNRILRAGGYFVWAAQPVYEHEATFKEQWEDMANLTSRMCWTLLAKDAGVAIWQKPLNNTCYLSREEGTQLPMCDSDDDPDNVWYADMKACLTRLPEEGYGSSLTAWPERLQNPPDRLNSIQIDAYTSRKDLFKAESKYWKEIIEGYVRALHWAQFKLRNVLDMRAGFGGFAAALTENKLDCWVLNVVPVNGLNTLPVIYDRGLIGVMHDWCEPFDTYPRTYDLIHAAGLFSLERKRSRCNISTIVLEMDRILRPGGHVYIRDSLNLMDELEEAGKAVGWHVTLRDTSEGPHASYRVLTGDKRRRT